MESQSMNQNERSNGMIGELTIIVQDMNTVRVRGDDGSEANGRFILDVLHRKLIHVFILWLAQNKISKRQELEVLGMILYNAIFNDDVELYLQKAVHDTQRKENLRIQLCFQEPASELARLPWEYLYLPDTETRKGFFLSTKTGLVLSRYMPLEFGRQSLQPEEGPLRILIAISKPNDLGPVIEEPVIEAIRGLPKVEVDILPFTTVDSLISKIKETKPHVIHFIGHGRFNQEENKGEIGLLDSDEHNVFWVGDREFAEFFMQTGSIPKLIFLHLCEGGVVDFNVNFAGLAPQLIRVNIQAVVAMQYPVTNRVAISFSKAFYHELANGEAVDYSVQKGRWRITLDEPNSYDKRDFGTPVLYMHSRDGIIQSRA